VHFFRELGGSVLRISQKFARTPSEHKIPGRFAQVLDKNPWISNVTILKWYFMTL